MKNSEERCFLIPLKQFAESGELKWLDGNQLWVQQYPFDSWSHPIFGETTIDAEKATRLKNSFDNGVRGQRIFADYEHGRDPAKGNKAAGDVKELKVVTEPRGVFTNPGLWARVQFTDDARKEIDSGEWNYWSCAHYDTWTHPQTGETHEMVYDGGGLTNKPYVKGMVPLNFSELGVTDEQVKEALDEDEEEVEEKPIVELKVDNETETDEGGDTDVELEKQLREKLGLSDDADIVKAVSDLSDEVQPIRDALKQNSERKAFSEAFPDEYKRMVALEASEQDRKAKMFSESFSNVRIQSKQGDESVDTTLGFTALVLDELQGVAKSFNEGTATLDDVKGLMDKVVAGGIVDYGTKGSSRENNDDDSHKEFNEEAAAGGTIQEVRKAFAERVTSIMTEDEVDYNTALSLAADKYPVLAEAYRGRNPINQ